MYPYHTTMSPPPPSTTFHVNLDQTLSLLPVVKTLETHPQHTNAKRYRYQGQHGVMYEWAYGITPGLWTRSSSN